MRREGPRGWCCSEERGEGRRGRGEFGLLQTGDQDGLSLEQICNFYVGIADTIAIELQNGALIVGDGGRRSLPLNSENIAFSKSSSLQSKFFRLFLDILTFLGILLTLLEGMYQLSNLFITPTYTYEM